MLSQNSTYRTQNKVVNLQSRAPGVCNEGLARSTRRFNMTSTRYVEAGKHARVNGSASAQLEWEHI